MKRKHFVKVVEETLDSLPQEFRSRIRNVAVLVEDFPPNQPLPQSGQRRRRLLGLFHGVPTTRKSTFDLPTGPDYIVLYQKNIEAVCSSEAEVREQIRLTVMHELGHYFGMDENQLKDVSLTSPESEAVVDGNIATHSRTDRSRFRPRCPIHCNPGSVRTRLM